MHESEDGLLGPVLADLLRDAHRAGPRDVAGLLWWAGARLGLEHIWVYLADIQQEHLIALPSPPEAGLPGAVGPEAVDIDGSLAGRAYRTETVQIASDDRSGTVTGTGTGTGTGTDRTDPAVAWLPMIDGIGRIGVLRVAAPVLDEGLLIRCEALASVAALLVATKAPFSDVLVETMRTRPMSLQAELLWAFVPPRTIGTRRVTSSALLEPAYEVGGDAFDHSVAGNRLHVTLVDAMGHDLASGGCSAVALAACRSTRRAGGTLADIATAIDTALTEWIPDRLLTCVIADLDTGTGELTWINCGHPAPLLLRGRRIVDRALERRRHTPLGLPLGTPTTPIPVHTARLEPGDRILIYSDGITDARDLRGQLFGEEQLVETVVRAMADGLPAPEALRRLMQRILTHQGRRLRDDATILLVDWHPEP
ncbi:PP2C family protein-serine/threonine phosphatase [Kitasatospora sp. NPDC004240]